MGSMQVNTDVPQHLIRHVLRSQWFTSGLVCGVDPVLASCEFGFDDGLREPKTIPNPMMIPMMIPSAHSCMFMPGWPLFVCVFLPQLMKPFRQIYFLSSHPVDISYSLD